MNLTLRSIAPSFIAPSTHRSFGSAIQWGKAYGYIVFEPAAGKIGVGNADT